MPRHRGQSERKQRKAVHCVLLLDMQWPEKGEIEQHPIECGVPRAPDVPVWNALMIIARAENK
jgi:hypothetical protein